MLANTVYDPPPRGQIRGNRSRMASP